MKELREIGKTFTVDIRDVVRLFEFMKNYMNWDFDLYRSILKEVDPQSVDRNWYFPVITPRFLILPDYRYSPIDPVLRKQGKIKGDDPLDKRIRLENFSTFNVFEIVDTVDSEIKRIFIGLMVDQYFSMRETKITGLSINVEYREGGPSVFSPRFSPRSYSDIEFLETSLETLKWAKGRKYPRFPVRKKVGVFEKIRTLEDTMLAVLNFLYTIYTGGYEKDTKSKLFEPLTKLLQSFGNTFEDVLTVAKGIAILFR